jgi:hypothetical protein
MVAIAIIHNSVDGSDKANIADETEFMNDVGTSKISEKTVITDIVVCNVHMQKVKQSCQDK